MDVRRGPIGWTMTLVLLALAAGCDDAPQEPQQPPEFPVGAMFEADIDEADVTDPALVGSWRIHFQGTLLGFLSRDGVDVVGNHYEVEGDELTLTDVAGGERCPINVQTGVYRWELNGDVMAFEPIDDPCEKRVELLTAATWEELDQP